MLPNQMVVHAWNLLPRRRKSCVGTAMPADPFLAHVHVTISSIESLDGGL
jgi:hypothetical protein